MSSRLFLTLFLLVGCSEGGDLPVPTEPGGPTFQSCELTEHTEFSESGVVNHSVHAYDQDGLRWRSELWGSAGAVQSYEFRSYDEAGNVVLIEGAETAGGARTQLFRYERFYDALGRQARVEEFSGADALLERRWLIDYPGDSTEAQTSTIVLPDDQIQVVQTFTWTDGNVTRQEDDLAADGSVDSISRWGFVDGLLTTEELDTDADGQADLLGSFENNAEGQQVRFVRITAEGAPVFATEWWGACTNSEAPLGDDDDDTGDDDDMGGDDDDSAGGGHGGGGGPHGN